MANLKMLKEPKKPKLPKKPSQNASFASKTAYIRKVRDIAEKFAAKKAAVIKENAHRKKVNDDSAKASQVIAGISGVEIFATGFSAKKLRLPRPGGFRKKATVSGTKKRRVKKAAPRKKAAKRRR